MPKIAYVVKEFVGEYEDRETLTHRVLIAEEGFVPHK